MSAYETHITLQDSGRLENSRGPEAVREVLLALGEWLAEAE